MSDEFVDPFDGGGDDVDPLAGETHEEVKIGPEDGNYPDITALKKVAGLTTAASLLDPEYDGDEGDFEPGLYKGFEILPPEEWPSVKAHAHIQRRFYVRHNDTVGMVPWAGSQIIWPWEAAWEQTLHRDTVTSFLKEEKKERKGA